MLLKSKATKNSLTKNLLSHSVPKFIQSSDWRHFYGAVTGDMMLLEFLRIIERALALFAPINFCYIRKIQPQFLLQKMAM